VGVAWATPVLTATPAGAAGTGVCAYSISTTVGPVTAPGVTASWSPPLPSTTVPVYGNGVYGAFGPGAVPTLTLSGLAPHLQVAVSLDLYVLGSWEGSPVPGAQPIPDRWALRVGTAASPTPPIVFQTSFTNRTAYAPQPGVAAQYYPAQSPTGPPWNPPNPPGTGAVLRPSPPPLGPLQPFNPYDSSNANASKSALYQLVITAIPHAASTLVLQFVNQSNSQADETFAFDNLRVCPT